MKNTEKDSLVSSVYNIIENRKGKVTAKHLEKEVGSIYKVRYALTRLVRERKIKRTRAFGINRIDYFYVVYNNEK
jgi:hypothetical protein